MTFHPWTISQMMKHKLMLQHPIYLGSAKPTPIDLDQLADGIAGLGACDKAGLPDLARIPRIQGIELLKEHGYAYSFGRNSLHAERLGGMIE
jgi:hypothetical protein